eukprot:s559_g7.t4
MASVDESLEAAYTGRGTGFLVQQDDGRVYYYNRATGSSQWHLPNHLYQSARVKGQEAADLVFPGKARAMLRVDCVTEAASAEMLASAMASAGMPPEEIHQANPLDVLDHFEQLLPPKLTRMLTTGSFLESCLADFQEVSGGKQLPIEDAATMVCTLVNSLRIEPSLALSEERCLRLAQKYDVDALFYVGPQEFLDLLRYVVVVRHSGLRLYTQATARQACREENAAVQEQHRLEKEMSRPADVRQAVAEKFQSAKGHDGWVQDSSTNYLFGAFGNGAENAVEKMDRKLAEGDATPLCILDAGCGCGGQLLQILHTARERGVPCYLRGLTAERIMERCAEELRPHVKSFDASESVSGSSTEGLEEDLVSCEAADFVHEGRLFDVIYCSWTLFHLADPLGTLMQLRQILAPQGVLLVNGAYLHFEDPKHDLEDQNTMDLFGLFCQQLAEHGLQCSVEGGPVRWIATGEDDGEYQGGYCISLRWHSSGESWREGCTFRPNLQKSDKSFHATSTFRPSPRGADACAQRMRKAFAEKDSRRRFLEERAPTDRPSQISTGCLTGTYCETPEPRAVASPGHRGSSGDPELRARSTWVTATPSPSQAEGASPAVRTPNVSSVHSEGNSKALRMSEHVQHVLLHFSQKNTFLDVRPVEDVPQVPRKKSWSAGDRWPAGLTFVAHGVSQKQPEIPGEDQGHQGQGDAKMLAKHRAGRCKPCVFFASNHGCPDATCSFCHLVHPLPPKQRPEKLLREEFRAAVQTVFRQTKDQPDLRLALKRLALQHPYLFRYIIGQMDMYSQRSKSLGSHISRPVTPPSVKAQEAAAPVNGASKDLASPAVRQRRVQPKQRPTQRPQAPRCGTEPKHSARNPQIISTPPSTRGAGGPRLPLPTHPRSDATLEAAASPRPLLIAEVNISQALPPQKIFLYASDDVSQVARRFAERHHLAPHLAERLKRYLTALSQQNERAS